MSADTIANKLTKPVSDFNVTTLKNTAIKMFCDHSKNFAETENQSTNQIDQSITLNHEMSLFDFSRLYKIGGVPIMDFVFVYILLYAINSLYLNLNFKIVLIATIPITILLDFVLNSKLKISNIILTIMMLCTFYLFICSVRHLNH